MRVGVGVWEGQSLTIRKGVPVAFEVGVTERVLVSSGVTDPPTEIDALCDTERVG